MTGWTRRYFNAAAVGGLAFSSRTARGQTKPRVVVIGGGIGGATAAKYLVTSIPAVDVTLVEPKSRYTTCFFSNLYLAGMRSLESLTHGYEGLTSKYGIKLVHDSATDIDPVAKRVRLAGGSTLSYDRLIISPGIAFAAGAIDGYDDAATEIMPHAWNAGPQTKLLRAQLEAMPDGGVFVIVAPPNPFRCPPGPYERAALAAYYFKQFKSRSKILILDTKDSFFEQDLFQDGWNRHYPGMIEWIPAQFSGGIKGVDIKAMSVLTGNESFKANVANVILPQVAADIARKTGLAAKSGWCPVDPFTFESTLHREIHVIGDSADAGDMPKSAFCANSQAKACAFAIASALAGDERPEPHLFNTCFTYLAGNDAISDAISFTPSKAGIKIADITMSQVDERKERRRRTVQEAEGWYEAFTRDVFA